MALSTETLIHFTKTKENLKSILQENFRIFMSHEELLLSSNSATTRISAYPIRVPMVCFCDIPLSQIKVHISNYGNYGLGMTKEWGKRMCLNPVLYIYENSTLSKSFWLAYRALGGSNPLTNEQKSLMDVVRYLKNYENYRHGGTKSLIPHYRFYDEREWRYVPPYSIDCDMLVSEMQYRKPDVKAAVDLKLVNLRLEFEPNDIKYIIINDDSEISEFIEHLRSVKSKKYSPDEIDRLTTRIMTSEQIHSDM